jgi:hypothetical protein
VRTHIAAVRNTACQNAFISNPFPVSNARCMSSCSKGN